MDGQELIDQATQVILFRREGTLGKLPTPVDVPNGGELRFGESYLLVLSPRDETTTVKVRNARTGADLETVSASGREPKQLATELEDILERHAGPDA